MQSYEKSVHAEPLFLPLFCCAFFRRPGLRGAAQGIGAEIPQAALLRGAEELQRIARSTLCGDAPKGSFLCDARGSLRKRPAALRCICASVRKYPGGLRDVCAAIHKRQRDLRHVCATVRKPQRGLRHSCAAIHKYQRGLRDRKSVV
jgi:hypothetical protein